MTSWRVSPGASCQVTVLAWWGPMELARAPYSDGECSGPWTMLRFCFPQTVNEAHCCPICSLTGQRQVDAGRLVLAHKVRTADEIPGQNHPIARCCFLHHFQANCP